MINGTFAKDLLDALVNQSNKKTVSFDTTNAYLGLFTSVPHADGTSGVEVSATALPGYHRRALGEKALSGSYQFGTPAAFHAATGDDSHDYYYIRNTGDIQMNAIDESASGEAVVKGVGIFRGSTSDAELLAWGPLVNKDGSENTTGVKLVAGSVPIFYAGSFELRIE